MPRTPIPRTDFGNRRDAEIAIQIFSILSGLCAHCPNPACRRSRSCEWRHPTCHDRARAAGSTDFDGALSVAGEIGLLAPLPDDPDGSKHIEKLELLRDRLARGRRHALRHPEEFMARPAR
ncbi:hypothetical protein [Flaviflagellibacter deserti]|uniref:Uncharacterized protein n=1 Tax=Flaviflagellibacter deserti TaxID=2267266 RepID=A0ABV9YZG6_9HYPH